MASCVRFKFKRIFIFSMFVSVSHVRSGFEDEIGTSIMLVFMTYTLACGLSLISFQHLTLLFLNSTFWHDFSNLTGFTANSPVFFFRFGVAIDVFAKKFGLLFYELLNALVKLSNLLYEKVFLSTLIYLFCIEITELLVYILNESKFTGINSI